jgi:ankyrin repeat protein
LKYIYIYILHLRLYLVSVSVSLRDSIRAIAGQPHEITFVARIRGTRDGAQRKCLIRECIEPAVHCIPVPGPRCVGRRTTDGGEQCLKMSLKFETFCDHAAYGRLALVQRVLESDCDELRVNGNLNDALVRAAENGHVDVIDYLLRHAMFDPSADGNCAIQLAAENGHLAVVERLLQDKRVDPSANNNYAVGLAAQYGHIAVVERLLRDDRVDPSANDNCAVGLAAKNGHIAVVERLLQDVRVDPSAENNCAIRLAAQYGHIAVVDRLMQDMRVDPSADDNRAVLLAACYGHLAVVERLLLDVRVDPSANDNRAVQLAASRCRLAVVDRLLEDDRVDVAAAIHCSRFEHRKRFECRERLTEICIALQDLALPAWVTIKILKAARPWSTLPLHSKWSLVCAVKHFHDKHNPEQFRA